jgi:glutamine amidotransferase
VVLPGVGAFGRCREALAGAGLDGVAADAATDALSGGRPFLGICVGMQLLYEASEESPGSRGLGVLPGTVRALPETVKRPQMQWNRLDGADHPMFSGLPAEPWVYFVHTYAALVGPDTVATCEYGGTVNAAVARGTLAATQFHPEKSGDVGLTILGNLTAMIGAPS